MGPLLPSINVVLRSSGLAESPRDLGLQGSHRTQYRHLHPIRSISPCSGTSRHPSLVAYPQDGASKLDVHQYQLSANLSQPDLKRFALFRSIPDALLITSNANELMRWQPIGRPRGYKGRPCTRWPPGRIPCENVRRSRTVCSRKV